MSFIHDEVAFGFDDVLLVPQYSTIETRKSISLFDPNLPIDFLPVMSSPMDTVTSYEMALELLTRGAVPILPRTISQDEMVPLVNLILSFSGHQNRYKYYQQKIGVAVGAETTPQALEYIKTLASAGVKIICLDIAHGHTKIAQNWTREVKHLLRSFSQVKLMVGSVCTTKAVADLVDWGADIIRFGVGNGSICSTRLNTGHGFPQLSGLYSAAKFIKHTNAGFKRPPVQLVADGGIRNAGDAAKALAAGADYVMLGSVLAGTEEAPGDVVELAGRKYKSYRGMASRGAQEARLGKAWSVEGVESLVPYKGPVGPILDEFEANLKSAYSYTGANGLKDFQERAEFVRVSPTTVHSETGTHIFNIASKS